VRSNLSNFHGQIGTQIGSQFTAIPLEIWDLTVTWTQFFIAAHRVPITDGRLSSLGRKSTAKTHGFSPKKLVPSSQENEISVALLPG
jgi:hypothetical protein